MKNKERYSKNVNAFSWDEVERVHQKKVCVAGCGGLGGYVCQTLARFGMGQITVVDGDVFNESNLNRQLFANDATLGRSKALVCKEQLALINPEVEVVCQQTMLDEKNAEKMLKGQDLVIDCLDTVPVRFLLMDWCERLGIPLVHGAIGGFYGQVANIFPGDRLLEWIYPAKESQGDGIEKELGNPGFTPQLVAAIQVSEGLKILAGKENYLRNALLHIDLLHNTMDRIELESQV